MKSKDKDVEKQRSRPVPRLRFPEFNSNGPWELRSLGEDGEFLPSLTGKSSSDFGVGASNYIPYTNVFSNIFIESSDLRSVNVKASETQTKVHRGDVLFTTSSETPEEAGFSSIVIDDLPDCYLNSFCTLFRYFPHRQPNPYFSGYLLRSSTIRSRLVERAQGSTRFNLSKKAFAELPIPYPCPHEQEKVAECLFSIDELIAAEERKLSALKAHKKALLQQLFPAEGETIPRLRFPEFRDAGEWRETELGRLLLAPPSYGLNAPAVPYTTDLPTYLRITDISEEGLFLPQSKVSVAATVTSDSYLDEGDIVVARTGASVGKSYRYTKDDGPLVFAGFLIRLRTDPRMLNATVIANLLQTQQYWRWVEKVSERSGQPGINGPQFASLPVMIPADGSGEGLKEQERIADFLSSLDKLLLAQSQKIAFFRAHKKGLMQQLFPSLDEVQA